MSHVQKIVQKLQIRQQSKRGVDSMGVEGCCDSRHSSVLVKSITFIVAIDVDLKCGKIKFQYLIMLVDLYIKIKKLFPWNEQIEILVAMHIKI